MKNSNSLFFSLDNFDWQRFSSKIQNLLNEKIKSKNEAEKTILVVNLVELKEAQFEGQIE